MSPRAASRLEGLGFPHVYDYVAGKADWDTCFVTNREGVVVGRLGRAALAADGDISVEDAMTLGPSTVRPSLELEKAVERMRNQNLTTLPVTRSDGLLIGLLRREDAERALAGTEA